MWCHNYIKINQLKAFLFTCRRLQELVLTLTENVGLTKDNAADGDCFFLHLRDDWVHTVVQQDDIVQLVTDVPIASNSVNHILANVDGGYVIVNPDNLISGTTVSTATICRRRYMRDSIYTIVYHCCLCL